MLDKRHLFTRHGTDLPPPGHPSLERKVLDKALQELSAEYKQSLNPWFETQLVCNFSRNNLTLEHLQQITEWLESNSLQLYALDLTFNSILSPTWKPILEIVRRLCNRVQLVDLGGNCLPDLEDTAELKEVQQTRRVSLEVPILCGSVNDWQREWSDIASEFLHKAYDPIEDNR